MEQRLGFRLVAALLSLHACVSLLCLDQKDRRDAFLPCSMKLFDRVWFSEDFLVPFSRNGI